MKKETEDLIVELPPEKEEKDQLALPLDATGLPQVGELKLEDAPKAEPKPKRERPEPKAEPKADDEAVEALRAQIKRLEEERNLERTAREQAQAEAARQRQEAEAATNKAGQSEKEMILSAVDNAKTRADNLKREMRLASENGEHERLAELQMQAAETAARKLQYEDRLADYEAKEKAPKPEPKRVEPSDPFEARIQTLSEPSKNWLRQHRECVTDEEMNAKVVWADRAAKKAGTRADTPEYFAYLDKAMGYAKEDEADDDGEEVEVEAPVARKSSAAPVSRRSSPDPKTGYIGNGQYQLTRAEVEMAEAWGMTPSEYNDHKQKAIKAGRYANG